MGAGCELPAGVGGENFLAIALEEIRRALKRGAGDARVAGVVTEREVELVGAGKRVAEISGEGAVYEVIVRALAVGLEIGGGRGIIEFTYEAAEVGATAGRGKIAAFGIGAERGSARVAAMGEELDDAGDGVAAVDGAFGASDDLDFGDIFGGEAGEIHAAAGRINGCAVDKNLGEIGIAAVQKYRSAAAERPGAINGDAGRKLQELGQRDGLAVVNRFAGDDIGRRGGLLSGSGNRLRSDDDAGRKRFEVEVKVQDAGLPRHKSESDFTR